MNQDAPFLQFLDRSGLTPGAVVSIAAREPHADAITVKPERNSAVTLGTSAATKILVEVVG